jgi:hypothetical protein
MTGAPTSPNYWDMSDESLAAAWREADVANYDDDYSGGLTETINFVEDAILQRIRAPDDASGDDPEWQDKIRAFGSRAT